MGDAIERDHQLVEIFFFFRRIPLVEPCDLKRDGPSDIVLLGGRTALIGCKGTSIEFKSSIRTLGKRHAVRRDFLHRNGYSDHFIAVCVVYGIDLINSGRLIPYLNIIACRSIADFISMIGSKGKAKAFTFVYRFGTNQAARNSIARNLLAAKHYLVVDLISRTFRLEEQDNFGGAIESNACDLIFAGRNIIGFAILIDSNNRYIINASVTILIATQFI